MQKVYLAEASQIITPVKLVRTKLKLKILKNIFILYDKFIIIITYTI